MKMIVVRCAGLLCLNLALVLRACFFGFAFFPSPITHILVAYLYEFFWDA